MIAKFILTLGLLLATTVFSQAQNMLGYSKEELKTMMSTLHQEKWKFDKEELNRPGVEIVQYRDREYPRFLIAFYLFDGVCRRYIQLMPKETLTTVISSLNKHHYHQGGNIWVSGDMKLKLTLDAENDDIIAIVTELIE